MVMTLSRRDLLKLALVGAAHPLLPMRGIVSQAFAAPGAADARFLLVFLRGGYDATNVVIPVGSPFYYEARPTIALPKPDPTNPQAAISLARPGDAAVWGLHPALKDSMLPLWQKGQLAFVPFAGTNDLTRSHFETQDSVESGMPLAGAGDAPHTYGSGFLNRLASVLDGKAEPVAFTDGLPMVMTGDVDVRNAHVAGHHHRRAVGERDRRRCRSERLAEGNRTRAVRRSADGAALRHVRGDAVRAA